MKKRNILWQCGALLAMLAIPHGASANTPQELLDSARRELADYNFKNVVSIIGSYDKAMAKDTVPKSPEAALMKMAATKSQNALKNVEKIVVLDSINVNRDEFFKAFKIPASSGRLSDGKDFPIEGVKPDYVFHSETDEYMAWVQPDTLGVLRLQECMKLADGSWHAEEMDIEVDGNAIYPFMMSDGTLLYFASDGEGSIGGYDIFKAGRDVDSGEFMSPMNIGMPYNSPFDDYLLAIDEENGIGWWATDRNQLGEDITIYVYKVNDSRVNYDSEAEENIAALAKIADYRSTWGEEDYTELLDAIDKVIPGKAPEKRDFYFPLRNGKALTTWQSIESPKAREAMQAYLDAVSDLDAAERDLKGKRKAFAQNKKDDVLAKSIQKLEKAVEHQRETVKKLKNEVYKAIGAK